MGWFAQYLTIASVHISVMPTLSVEWLCLDVKELRTLTQQQHNRFPVDSPVSRNPVFVGRPVVVVEMGSDNKRTEGLQHRHSILCYVRVSRVIADPDMRTWVLAHMPEEFFSIVAEIPRKQILQSNGQPQRLRLWHQYVQGPAHAVPE